MSRHERILIDGPAGRIEVFVEPREGARGIALISHPHPLFGGTADNKVVTTLARTFRELGYVTLRPNFRGVGASEGAHDHGEQETDDQLAVLDYARRRFGELPLVLAGFSFGAYVSTRIAKRLAEAGRPASRLVLVGTAAGFVEGARTYRSEAVAADTIVIHGAADATVPLANVLAWAEPLNLPVTVIPGADHFFHRRLHLIRDIICRGFATPPSPLP
ncbi:alpha/beta hydrolase [Denitratisoma sp. DHT3]|uniref:alpha/beta hydrolase n=1 Tax=Denitratisoma sp. DHT3 TaxID=1981880 RepID=UPI0011985091|nr:alpha/beta fold hydrolase [Denitratisoma sp. DHT3]QDX82128.1 alpha/beta hydrolase [Denitratisoma sp. DHT3]